MTDEMVRRAQVFVNAAYGSRIGMTIAEDGKTGWPTMYALTRALQLELGIATRRSTPPWTTDSRRGPASTNAEHL
ncbi:hypothetical protein ABZW10_29085 [Kitasatospora sp. NPDC004723]|uniref:hypothetical protein n=1 Tax=Kitasatospora sp. NPDC004723 TaxID=3154288 RepID=UPI0033A51736